MNCTNSKLSKDAVKEFQRVISNVFEEVLEDRNLAGDPVAVRPSWVLVSCVLYVPGAKHRYELRNTPVAPLLFQGKVQVDEMPFLLSKSSMLVKPGQELAVNTSVVIGWENGTVGFRDLEIYDGAPNLKVVSKRIFEKFEVLRTGNSYHFYAKDRAKLCDVQYQVDEKWLAFRRDNAGYIRVTSNVKGPIEKVQAPVGVGV